MSRWLLLFDIDGTLLRSRGQGLRAMHAAFQEVFGLPPRPARIQPHGKTDRLLFAEMARAYGLPPEALQGQLHTLEAVYVCRCRSLLQRDGVDVKPGVAALLAALSRRGDVDLGLVTGNVEPVAWSKLDVVALKPFFAGGAFGSDARERSALVQLAMTRLGGMRRSPAALQRVWVIGDTPADVASGKAVGTRTLAVATGVHDAQALVACGADVVVEDFTDTRRTVDTLCGGR